MAISGQKTVTAAGTAETLGTTVVQGPLMIKALAANTGLIFIGNDGANDVASTNGMELAPGDALIFDWIGSFVSVYIDSAVNGEGVSWLKLSV